MPSEPARNTPAPLSAPTRAPVRASGRLLAASGALLAACAVALSAYAAHGAEGLAQSRLQTAAVFAFGHGVALAALARHASGPLARIALCGLLAGTVLFGGGVAASALVGQGGGVAPFGGTLLIAAWLAYAASALRRSA